jgi:putative DNA primase/helicase
MSAAVIARRLGGQRQGNNWRCACPLECGYSLSLSDGEDGKLLAYCFGGHEYHEILAALVEFGLLDDDAGDDLHVSRRVIVCQRDVAKRIAHARQVYDSGVLDERIQIYLCSRGIELVSPVLRFAEHAPHRLGARFPAMLAPVVNVSGEQIGVHMTYLRLDGAGKADLPKKFQRESRGAIRGGAIRLADHDPGTALIIGEGVETVLSAMQIFGLAGWSAVFAGGLKTIELPPIVRRIVIAADNDANVVTGQRNAIAAYDRWAAEGRSVTIKAPPDVGDDFSDVLTKRRCDARH